MAIGRVLGGRRLLLRGVLRWARQCSRRFCALQHYSFLIQRPPSPHRQPRPTRSRPDQPSDHSLVQTAGAALLSGGAQTPRERGFGERAVIVRVCAGFRLGAGAGCAQQRRRESESVGAGPHDEARGAMHGMAAHLALLAVDDGLGDVDDPLHLLRRLAPAVPHRGLGVDQLPTRSTTPSLTGRQLGARRAAAQRGQCTSGRR